MMSEDAIRLVLTGDVMLARGIDQIRPRHVDPELREPVVDDARSYVALAERTCGPVPRDVPPEYPWGVLAHAIREFTPHAVVINLENALTTSNRFDPTKGIHYRSHPANVAVLKAIGRPVTVLANNHVLDLEEAGLRETLRTLETAGLPYAGAGRTADAAWSAVVPPAELGAAHAAPPAEWDARLPVAVIACCTADAGVPPTWAAGEEGGVALLPDLGERGISRVREVARPHHEAGRLVVLSLHWGGNWGFEPGADRKRFARELIDQDVVQLVHGHSSHHPGPLEVRADHLVLYGCGDLINDYEGIGGHEGYRPDLALVYLVTLDARSGTVREARFLPLRRRRFTLEHADGEARDWLASRLSRANEQVDGPALRVTPDGLFME